MFYLVCDVRGGFHVSTYLILLLLHEIDTFCVLAISLEYISIIDVLLYFNFMLSLQNNKILLLVNCLLTMGRWGGGSYNQHFGWHFFHVLHPTYATHPLPHIMFS